MKYSLFSDKQKVFTANNFLLKELVKDAVPENRKLPPRDSLRGKIKKKQ